MMNNNKTSLLLKNNSRELLIVLAQVLMIMIFTVINPLFVSWGNMKDIIDMSTIYGLMALGMSFAIISGGIDLSAGAAMALMGILLGKMPKMGIPVPVAIGITIISGGFFGFINGFLVSKMRIQPFIATLATQNVFRGIAFLITDGYPITSIPNEFRNVIYGEVVSGIRVSSFIFIIAAIVMHMVLKYTKFGNYVYAVGGNAEAAKLSGVNVERTKIMAFVTCGLCESLAAIALLAKLVRQNVRLRRHMNSRP